MSEQHNGVLYTLTAGGNPDYDIVVPDDVGGTFLINLLKMADRTYKHIQSNEAMASKAYKDAEGDEAAQAEALRKFRMGRRELIMTGELGFRQVGPRMSDFDREWLRLIDQRFDEQLKKIGEKFPTSGKAVIQGKSLNEWRELYKSSPKWAHLKDEAAANVAASKARVEAAKAAGGDKIDLAADLV